MSKELEVGDEFKKDFNKRRYDLVPTNELLVYISTDPFPELSVEDAYVGILKNLHCDLNIAINYLRSTACKLAIILNYRSEFELITEMADLYTFGVAKYSENSWKKLNYLRVINAMGRHMEAGYHNIDSDSGKYHALPALWNAVTALWLLEYGDER